MLAYSTVSQLGYMFVGVGLGAYVAGVFHLVTHAFFKALLFLGSGSVIYAMHRAYHHTRQPRRRAGHAQHGRPQAVHARHVRADVDRDAGDRRHSAVRRLLLEGRDPRLACSRARSDSTLADAHWLGIPGSALLYRRYVLGLAAAFMTAVYMTRMMLYTFHGPNRTGEKEREHLHEAPWVMTGPLVVLGVLTRRRRLAQPAGVRCIPRTRSACSSTGSSRWSAQRRCASTGGAARDVARAPEYALVGARGR